MSGDRASEFPHVEVYITTSSETLDIMGDDPFYISLKFVLRSDSPITLDTSGTLFALNDAVRKSGLSLIDVENGDIARRYETSTTVCFGEESRVVIPETKAVTLYPNKEYTVSHKLGPSLGFTYRPGPKDQPFEEGDIISPSGQPLHRITTRAWWGTLGLKSRTYEISVSPGNDIRVWKYSPLWKNPWAWLGPWAKDMELQQHSIPYQVETTAMVTVKQTDNPDSNMLCHQF